MDDSNLRIMIEAQNRASKTLEQVQKDVSKMAAQANKDLEKVKSTSGSGILNGLKGAAATAGQGLLSFGKILGDIAWKATIAGAAAAALQLASLGTLGLKAGMDLQKTQTGIIALTGSVDTANDLMKDFYTFAANTPFEFPDIAKAGQTLLGFGRTAAQAKGDVRVLGNISAATGADFNSLALVFGQVNAAGRLMGQDALQLINNNVPITGILAKKLGISVAEVKEKMEDGAISAKMFNDAIKEFAPPDALEKMAQTLPGRISTLQDSLTALGFSFVGIDTSFDKGGQLVKAGGLFDIVTKAVEDLSKAMSDPTLNKSMASLGTSLGQTVGGLVGLIQPLIPAVSSIAAALVSAFNAVVPGIAGVLSGMLPGLQVFMGALSSGFQSVTPVITDLGKTIGGGLSVVLKALAPAIAPIAAGIKQLAPIFGQLVAAVAPFIAQVISGLTPILPPLIKAIVAIVEPLAAGLVPILPVVAQLISQLAGVFAQILTAITPLIPPLMQLAMMIIQQLLLPILPALIPLFQMMAQVITMIVQALMPLMPPIMQLASTLIASLAPILPTLITLFVQLIQALIPILPPLLQLVTILLPPLVALLRIVAQVAGAMAGVMMGVVVGAISAVIKFIGTLIGWISRIYTWFGQLGQMASNAATKMLTSISNAINGVIRWFQNLPGTIVKAIGNMGNTLYNAGKDLIDGLMKGAGSMIGSIGNFFLDKLPGWIKEPFKKAMGIASPSKVFGKYGVNIGEGVIGGVQRMRGAIVSTVQRMAGDMQDNFNPDLSMTATSGLTAAGVAGASQSGNNINVGSTSTANHFMAPINLTSKEAVDAWYDKIDAKQGREQQLAQLGVAI